MSATNYATATRNRPWLRKEMTGETETSVEATGRHGHQWMVRP
jgi:hypothetical protein